MLLYFSQFTLLVISGDKSQWKTGEASSRLGGPVLEISVGDWEISVTRKVARVVSAEADKPWLTENTLRRETHCSSPADVCRGQSLTSTLSEYMFRQRSGCKSHCSTGAYIAQWLQWTARDKVPESSSLGSARETLKLNLTSVGQTDPLSQRTFSEEDLKTTQTLSHAQREV